MTSRMTAFFAAAAAVLALGSSPADAGGKKPRAWYDKITLETGPKCVVTDNNPCSGGFFGYMPTPFETASRSPSLPTGKKRQIRPDRPGRAAIASLVEGIASTLGVPARIARAVARHESGFNPQARGAAGEYGVMQIKCQTARSVGFTGQCRDLHDAPTNIYFGVKYLGLAIAKGGHGCNGVTLYNTGIHRRPFCSAYGRRVMASVP